MQIRIYEGETLVYEGLIKPGARKFGLQHETLKKRALAGGTYRHYRIEAVPEPEQPAKEIRYCEEKLETIQRYGNTISCKKDIEPLMNYLKSHGVKAEATWEPKKDGVRGGWLIETKRRGKGVQERVEKLKRI